MAQRLIMYFDGTWNRPDDAHPEGEHVETNVCRLFESVLAHDGNGRPQRKWYDEGVGTQWYERVRGGAFGLGLSEHIRQGYRWLIERHRWSSLRNNHGLLQRKDGFSGRQK